MSKLIPPLVSTTPPPIGIADADDNEDDEFGDFSVAAEDTTYSCDSNSIPNSPDSSPKKLPQLASDFITLSNEYPSEHDLGYDKDFQDKRKGEGVNISEKPPEIIHNGLNSYEIEPQSVPIQFNECLNGCVAYKEANDGESEENADGRGSAAISTNFEDECDDFEKPPMLCPEDCENEDISETPSNFSISFDENAVEDQLEENAVNMVIELPKHEECIDVLMDKPEEEQLESNIELEDEDFGEFSIGVSPKSSTEEKDLDIQQSEVNKNDLQQVNGDVCNAESFISENVAEFRDVATTSQNIEDDEFDDFADFSSAAFQEEIVPPKTSSQEEKCEELAKKQDDEDDFGDFDDYTTVAPSVVSPQNNQIPLLQPEKVVEQAENIFKTMFDVVSASTEEGDVEYSDYTQTNGIFKEIKDVTETHALSYQWGKSSVQQGLLKALNIDTRNILYAHGMAMPKFASNLGMTPLEPVKSDILVATPTSAKSRTMQPTPSNSSTAQGAAPPSDIPVAQFDWNESGLANPLDSNISSTLFDLEQLTATFSIPTTAAASNSSTTDTVNLALEDWDLWLQSISKEEEAKITAKATETPIEEPGQKLNEVREPRRVAFDTESVNSLQFPEVIGEPEDSSKCNDDNTEEFSGFTSFQGGQNETTLGWSSNMVPLRETYIDNVKADWNDDVTSTNVEIKSKTSTVADKNEIMEPEWLEPTIQTSVLPCKDVAKPEVVDGDDFADFQDFQTSAPEASVPNMTTFVASSIKPVVTSDSTKGANSVQNSSTANAFGGNLLAPTVLQPTLLEPVRLNQSIPQQIVWPDPGITDEELERFDLYAKQDGNYNASSTNLLVTPATSITTSSIPASSTCSNVVSVTSTPEAPASKPAETKLSGPGGALMVERSVVVPANKVILPFNEVILPPNNQVVISKDLVLPILESSPRKYTPQKPAASLAASADGEDDWSDFVSSHPPGASSTQLSPNRRTDSSTTSELSLSIPQLRSIQPNKPPIPVITPRGLVQTKIPTKSPSTPTKSLQHTPLHAPPPRDGYQPAIISNQFEAHVNQSTFSDFLQSAPYQTTNISANAVSRRSSHVQKLNGFHDDTDEWSDFMSSQPVSTGNNSLYNTSANADWNRNANNGFVADMPNIITNPVHFQSYPTANAANSLAGRKSNGVGVLHSRKPQNLNVAGLPDLDFVAPKTKAYNNNKSNNK